jgi:hypothetical protein
MNWRKAIVAYSRDLSEGTEEDHERPQSEERVSWSGFEQRAHQIIPQS